MKSRSCAACALVITLLTSSAIAQEIPAGLDFDLIHLSSEPSGAVVIVGGRVICRSTPCRVKLNPGQHTLRFLHEFHLPWKETLTVHLGQHIEANLEANYGNLKITSTPPGLSLSIDGEPQEQHSLEKLRLTPGTHIVEVRDPCFTPLRQTFEIKTGQTLALALKPQAKQAGLELSLLDLVGEVLDGVATLDGVELGPLPGRFKVPSCAKTLEVVTANNTIHRTLALRPRHLTRLELELKLEVKGFVLVPMGSFVMGSPIKEKGHMNNEQQRRVVIDQPFFLATHETTQAEWIKIMGKNPSSFANCGLHCPVESVSWWDTLIYLNKLSEAHNLDACYTLKQCSGQVGAGCEGSGSHCTGQFSCQEVVFEGFGCEGYRLPGTEEWEYASRATLTGPNHGSPDDIGWYSGNSGSKTHPVEQKQPNAWGFFDMQGNVSEWTGSPQTPGDPLASNSDRVTRGGFYGGAGDRLRSAYHYAVEPTFRGAGLGFRVARTAP